MNDQITIQLKTLVERAVRPVRASTARKMQMREELLAHVTDIFTQEFQRTGDEQAAVREARRRFGDPAELTPQLEQSVTRQSRFYAYLDAWWGCPPEEFTVAAAARYATRVGGASSAAILSIVLLESLFKPDLIPDGYFTLIGAVALGIGLFTATLMFVSFWMQHALERRSWRQAVAIAALSGLIPPANAFGLQAAVSAAVEGFHMAISLLPLSMLLMPIAVIGIACGLGRELRVQRQWSHLVVD